MGNGPCRRQSSGVNVATRPKADGHDMIKPSDAERDDPDDARYFVASGGL